MHPINRQVLRTLRSIEKLKIKMRAIVRQLKDYQNELDDLIKNTEVGDKIMADGAKMIEDGINKASENL